MVVDVFRVTYLPAAVDPEVVQEQDRAVEEQMTPLRFYDLDAGCPTQAAALVSAKDPLLCPVPWRIPPCVNES